MIIIPNKNPSNPIGVELVVVVVVVVLLDNEIEVVVVEVVLEL